VDPFNSSSTVRVSLCVRVYVPLPVFEQALGFVVCQATDGR